MAAALGSDLATVIEIEPNGEWGLVRAGVGWDDGLVGRQRLRLADATSLDLADSVGGEVTSAIAATSDGVDLRDFIVGQGVKASASVPLSVPGGKVFGFLRVDYLSERTDGEDVTDFLRTCAALLGQVIDRLLKNNELERTNERYRLIVENARDYVIVLTDPDETITGWLPGAETILGWTAEEMVGRPVAAIFTPEDRHNGIPEKEAAAAIRNGVSPDVRWHQAKDGRRVFLDGQTIAMHQSDGSLRGFLKIGQDVTERKRNDERRTILLAELQHRVRNVLAIVAAVINRTAAGSIDEFKAILTGRIHAMARTQTLLTRGVGVGVDVGGIVRDELDAQGAEESRVSVEGPAISLAPKAAEVLTLAVHELATNAMKYGALCEPDGRLRVSWSTSTRERERWLEFHWEENGYRVEHNPNRRKGFGTELITQRVPYELRGTGDLDLGSDGLRCRIGFPLRQGESILQTSIPRSDNDGDDRR